MSDEPGSQVPGCCQVGLDHLPVLLQPGLRQAAQVVFLLAVQALNRQLDMGDVNRDLHFSADGKNLVNRLSEVTVLVPDVVGETTVVICRYFGEGDDLVGC